MNGASRPTSGEPSGARAAVVPPASRLEQDERWARAALGFLVEPGHTGLVPMVKDLGAVETLAAVRAGRAGRAAETYVRLPDLDVRRIATEVQRVGARVVVPGDPEWPVRVEALRRPPLCLYVSGSADLADDTGRSVSVVGSRMASDYGRAAAADLGEGLASRGWASVSGAATGIDAAVHRGTLAAGGCTVAVLACGIDRVYPRTHGRLLEAVRQHGAVVTEMPPGSAPLPRRFLARNRLIAALSRATVVVEASLRSGSLSTANEAATLARPVAAYPGPVTSATSAGCHRLLRHHVAELVTNVDEVLELAASIGEELAPEGVGEIRPTDGLDPVEHQVWSVTPLRRWVDPADLASAAGVDPALVPRAVAVLEALGLLDRDGDRVRKASPPAG
ncbi:DNA-processing protein DprA [Phycicoccus avicenniae]|uniref:DNA-processing protein DprA n=1 Tax=Phycicoccus avicenniae TaxID=2828860 RepID=UPI0020128DCD|nr:DNA-processing protein DprA [Phycicoccus avicenniae]